MHLDFFYEFASTYSYIAAMRIAPLAKAARRHGALAAVPARADLQGAGLGHLAVQSLSRQGPLHGARLRTAMRRARACVPFAGAVPASHADRRARRAGGFERRLGRGFRARGLSRAVCRRPQYRRSGRHRRHRCKTLGHDGAAVLARAQTDEIKGKLRAETEEAQRLGIFGAPSFIAERRTVLGQRPAGTGARLREEKPIPSMLSSRHRQS